MKATLKKDIESKGHYKFNKGDEFEVLDNNQKSLIQVQDWLGFKYWIKREYFNI